ncbi:STAS domain-containing protein [Gemmatimonadota bacterium]
MSEFSIDLQGGIAKIDLGERVDTTNAGDLTETLRTLVGQDVSKVVMEATNLEYLSSAGLRAIVFAKQKIGQGLDVILVGAREEIVDVITMTGFDSFVTIQDSFEG